ncbi:putative integral membrane protein (TIGR00698 family) [Eoetvoesiella caeni]|uniref:Putative integral membrane protein (TIGR00698 family) n=2 Tax=Eoetvoesiella caeni TaxID=645616 RepID=A0A366HMT8_9BURK|nr:putative integral membrane protein (TIGR00698 family) [Eoetvoesiella caeni]
MAVSPTFADSTSSMNQTATLPARPAAPLRQSAWWLGLLLTGTLAAASLLLAKLEPVQQLGISALTLAIVLGIVAGNTFFPSIAGHTAAGVDFSKNKLLRAGIILYGFRITFQQIGDIGWAGVLIAALMVGLTFTLAVQLGTRLFKLDKQTSMLIGAGSAICGAAAVMAAEPVVRGQAHKVSIAVATVVVFGTLSMFLYPLLYSLLPLSEHAYGVFAGSTIHEVAQVVAAGKAVSDAAAGTAVIEKMLRVMMLAPFLLILSGVVLRRQPGDGAEASKKAPIVIPWFAVFFIAVSGINSLHLLPADLVQVIVDIDTALLAMAMAALGLRTHAGAIRQAGFKPLMLAATLFAFLIVGGYGINLAVMQWLG